MPMTITTEIAYDWAVRSFGREHVHNTPIRTLRLAEEAVELAQAAGVSKQTLHDLIDVVYSRPMGDVRQEIGGVLMTVTVLCASFNEDPKYYFETELKRVLNKPAEHFRQRNQEKLDLGLNA